VCHDDTIRNARNHRGLPIDVRGFGGYVVAPPSQNRNGIYTWEIAPHEVAVAEAPAWLLAWVRGKDGSGAYTHCKVLLTVQPDRGSDLLARVIAYLAQCPGAISGRGGHDQTFEVARVIVYGFNLGPELGFHLLWDHY